MLPTDFLESAQVPDGYAAIPLSKDESRASLRIGVLVRLTPDPVGGSLVLLRDAIDSKAYLGCLADAGGRVHQWLEICVQTAPDAAAALDAHRQALTKALLDARWQQWMRALDALPGDTLIRIEGCASLEGMPGAAADTLPFNIGAGLLLARPLYPLSYEELLAVLAGGTWQGMRHGRELLLHGHAASPLHDASAPERTFMGARVKEQRIVETFHLKVALLKDLFTIVRATIQQQQRPLLNLSADSFRATFAGSQAALPILWTSRVMLTNPGEAFEITAVSGQAPFFVRAGERKMSAYEPPIACAVANRRASMRIRALLDGGRDRTVIEGTLQVHDDFVAGKRDLAWLRLEVGGESVALYGHLERDRALGPQEWRFRSLAQAFSGKAAESLRAAEGVLFDDVPLQVIPVLSSPCDLYAMAVLAVRTLLVNRQTTLAVALDEMTSLARAAANASATGDDLPGVIAGLFADDPRWAGSLGPNRLVNDEVSPEQAFGFVPPAFWWETLAMMARMFPGVGPFSACRDYGDAPVGGLHTVFDRSVADAERLALNSRDLIVDNRRMNMDVQKALSAFMNEEHSHPMA